VLGAVSSRALVDDVAVCHEEEAVEDREGFGRWLVNRGDHSLALLRLTVKKLDNL
jgi:hypothetical protein